MDGRRWWDVAFGPACVIVGVVVTISETGSPGRIAGTWIVLAALSAVYYLAGRRTLETDHGGRWFVATLIVLTAIGTAFSPNFLTLQCLVFPLIWVLTPTTRQAVILNVVSATALGIGFVAGLGATPEIIGQALAIQTVSLVFALSLGLWITRIAELGEEKARLLVSLQAAQAESERASREAGAAAERERLARDIHDTIAQSLTSVVLLAQRARAEVGQTFAGTGDAAPLDGRPPAVSESIDLIESTAREALGEARALVATMAAMPTADSPLGDSLRRLGQRFERETGVRVTVAASIERLPRATEVVLLRCAQEGLANIRKHAAAESARIILDTADGHAELLVTDDGVGITTATGVASPSGLLDAAALTGFGLHGLRDRVALLQGTVDVESVAGHGTRLIVRVPVATTAAADDTATPSTERGHA